MLLRFFRALDSFWVLGPLRPFRSRHKLGTVGFLHASALLIITTFTKLSIGFLRACLCRPCLGAEFVADTISLADNRP